MSGRSGTGACASWAREVDLNPAGTAPQSDIFVLIEHPLPWPSDIGQDPLLAHLERVARTAAGEGRTVRLQAIACPADAANRSVIVFATTGRPFAGYGRSEASGAVDELSDLVDSLVRAEPPPAIKGCVTDVLVCTHGSRDTCCGSLGTRLWRDGEPHLEELRLWRTSHTGGHRFAPTAITFPDGNYWAHLDPELLRGIVTREVPADVAAACLRGCAAFTAAVQVADRAVLAERGWDWLDCDRFGDERTEHRVELCFESPDGRRGGFDICVDESRRLPIPDCGGDPAAATKFQTELIVTRLRSWT